MLHFCSVQSARRQLAKPRRWALTLHLSNVSVQARACYNDWRNAGRDAWKANNLLLGARLRMDAQTSTSSSGKHGKPFTRTKNRLFSIWLLPQPRRSWSIWSKFAQHFISHACYVLWIANKNSANQKRRVLFEMPTSKCVIRL